MLHKALMICISIILLSTATPISHPVAQSGQVAADINGIIEKYQQEIPQHMQQDNIPGLAIAIVDDQGILWNQGFGYTDWDQQIPVTQDTLFSIQSMSKSFTATAALFAAQDGLVDLDAPITEYLPDFHINSIFEEHPEQKITLRMLLSHTAGLAHEAPYGGNYDHPAYSFEKHIASISDTWLKFPVGSNYSYSNLGVDLAGYILQERSGISFIQYVQDKVFKPLGMKNSTLDVNQVRADHMRAIGHAGSPIPPPVDFLIIPSGGVWSTTTDMARYLQFHINEGAINGQRLLQQDLAETMYTPPNMAAQYAKYGLGITVDRRNGAPHFQHGGGGFGFNSSMVWYPDLKLGSVVLTNSVPQDSYAYNLSEAILDTIIASSPQVYAQRTKNAAQVAPAYPPFRNNRTLSNIELKNLIEKKALAQDPSSVSRRSHYAGKYVIQSAGFPGDQVDISDANGQLSVTYLGNTSALTEVKPGVFFSASGDSLIMNGSQALLAGIHMRKITPLALVFHLSLYSICGLIFLAALLFWPVRAIIREIRHHKVSTSSAGRAKNVPVMAFAAGLVALVSLISLACLVFVVSIPNLIYFPWPHPFLEMKSWQSLLFYMPYLSLALTAVAVVLAGLAYHRHGLAPLLRAYLLAAFLALFTFNAVLLI
jgi:CubicO group peptidase (beta-lactamase class C family)